MAENLKTFKSYVFYYTEFEPVIKTWAVETENILRN